MDEIDLFRQVCETNAGYMALGNEHFQAHGATFIRNRQTPRRHDANGVTLIRSASPADIEALLQRVEVEFAGQSHRTFT
ncbi:MAG TPA: hypothetical protein VIB47_14325, partial [Dehalococcoidia bacterium]